ncbi:SOUL family heme-binding protein [Rubritalea sp.]|uniref:SOUL family heme-binding protein n=1 Tax=Rubritalea sp. TaxID=2109375 RepID=UPI003EF65115
MKNFQTKLVLLAGLAGIGSAQAIEKPAYQLLKQDGKLELRQYGELHIVTATMDEEGQRNQAFRKLAGYIGKKNDKQQKIAMTSPVLIDGAKVTKPASSQKPSMSFVVPQNVVEAGIPKPNDPAISISKIDGGKFAVNSFKNSYSETSRKEALDQLRVWIGRQKLTEVGEPSFAFYDPPWIPQMFRTNEVWIKVKDKMGDE